MTADCIIIGGGTAGLSAALVLGRSCRKVVVCDAGKPRNAPSPSLHCFPGRDGAQPAELLRICRGELTAYPGVSIIKACATDVEAQDGGFQVTVSNGMKLSSASVILATGVTDELPDIPEVEKYFGVSVLICPYCDGWENRDRPLIVAGHSRESADLARELTLWSKSVSLCTNSDADLPPELKACMEKAGVRVHAGKIAALEGIAPKLKALRLSNGERVKAEALFFHPEQKPRSPLAGHIGCELSAGGDCVKCGAGNKTSIPGIFAAGNLRGGLELAIVAAADGIKAGVSANEYLLELQFQKAGSKWFS